MKDYILLKLFIIFFLAFYFVAGLSTELLLPQREKDFPPFFSWFLFDRVPNEHKLTQYSVRLLEVNGKKLSPPVFFEDAYGIIDNPTSPRAKDLIRRFGFTLDRGRSREAETLRQTLEQVYLPSSTYYQLVIVIYDPILRFSEGEYELKVLGEFQRQ